MYDFLLPDIGEGLHEAEIIKWFVEEGQSIKENSPLVEVQTDKAVVEITAPVTGEISKLGAAEGESIIVGTVLCQFNTGDNGQRDYTPQRVKQELLTNVDSNKQKVANSSILGTTKAAPSVRKAARDAGIHLEDIVATGPNGRVLRSDLEAHLKNASIEVKESMVVATSQHKSNLQTDEPIIVPLRGVRKAIFENMKKSVQHAVLCTGMEKFNVTELVRAKKALEQLPELQNVKLTYLPFILKAVAEALKQHPHFNATVDEDNKVLVLHPHIHLGIAVATSDGLIVPVIRHADKKTVVQIARELENILERVETKKIQPNELKGSTFTVSSTGKDGGTYATPITNYPEVAILGAHKIIKEPVVLNDEIIIGHTMTLSCTFDHRVIDGEPAGRFMQDVAKYLLQPLRFLI